MVLFPNAEVTIYRETPHGTIIGYENDGNPDAEPPVEPTPILLDCGNDGFDNKSYCLNKFADKIIGDFQSQSSSETMKEYGNISQSGFLLILDLDIDIRADDKVKITKFRGSNSFNGYYQVMGDPGEYISILPHLEVKLTKERKG